MDHSSFDETDSFGVDELALESTSYSKECQRNFQSQAIVMRDGKVRRRMRWRPKSMMKRRRPRLPLSPPNPRPSGVAASPHELRMNKNRFSSSSSVNSASNASESSKQSRRSLHSFASIETQVKSNKTSKSSQKRRFPLPRPNYSTTLDGIPSDSPSLFSTDSSSVNGEDALLLNRAANDTTFFDTTDSVFPIIEEKKEEEQIELLIQRPPLGTSRSKQLSRPRAQSASSFECSRREEELAAALGPLKITRSTPRSDPLLRPNRSPISCNDIPLPSLSGEEIEKDRRVDLRVRVPADGERHLDHARVRRSPSSASERSMDLLTISELRVSLDERDDGDQLSICRTMSSNMVKKGNQSAEAPGSTVPLAKTSSRLSTASGNSAKKRFVDPVIGPSFGTVLESRSEDSGEGEEGEEGEEDERPPMTSTSELRMSVGYVRELDGSQVISPGESYDTTRTDFSKASVGKPPSTVPVDLDDCSYIEAEKNLQAIHDMAAEHLRQGEYDEALDVFEEILRGQLTRYGRDHYRVGTALHNIGIVHMRRRDFPNAAKAYREAVAIRKQALAPDHPDVASSLAQLGVAYLERRMHKKAISAFRESLMIRRACLGNTHPKVAKILNNIGCALYELNVLEVAQVAFEEALEIQRFNLREAPVEEQDRSNYILLSIASTLSNIASIKLYFNNFDEASVDFQEALLIQQCVFGDDHPVPLQTEESLKWIDSTRAQHVPNASQYGIFSKLFRRGSGSGAALLAEDSEATVGKEPRLLSCTVRDEGRGAFGTVVERRLMALQRNIDLACGPERKFEDDGEDDFDEHSGSATSLPV